MENHVEFVIVNGVPGVLFPTPEMMYTNAFIGIASEYPNVYDLAGNSGKPKIAYSLSSERITDTEALPAGYMGTVILRTPLPGEEKGQIRVEKYATTGPFDYFALRMRLRKAAEKMVRNRQAKTCPVAAPPSPDDFEEELVTVHPLAVWANDACIEEEAALEDKELLDLAYKVNAACIEDEAKLPGENVIAWLSLFWPETARALIFSVR